MSEINKLKQRISILESSVQRLINIANVTGQIVQDAQYDRHYCECGTDVTDMNENCGTPNCPHGLCPDDK